MRTVELGIIGLLLILIVTNFFIISKLSEISKFTQKITEPLTTKPKPTFKTSGIILDNKPVSLPNYIINSDFIFPENGWLSNEAIPPEYQNETILQQTFGWKSNGYVKKDEMGRKGVIFLHPVSETLPRYLETPEFLLPDSGFVVIGFANQENFGGKGHGDNVFKVYVVDPNKGLSIKIDEFVISNQDGWKDIAYPIKTLLSEFSNKKIKIRVEGWSGGEYPWYGEWGVVDYIDVIS
jgi:hypothetical protein